jgi:hypothetical protein
MALPVSNFGVDGAHGLHVGLSPLSPQVLQATRRLKMICKYYELSFMDKVTLFDEKKKAAWKLRYKISVFSTEIDLHTIPEGYCDLQFDFQTKFLLIFFPIIPVYL